MAFKKKYLIRTCAHCHGGSSSAAANLYLTEGKSYEALVNRPSKKVDGMLLVSRAVRKKAYCTHY